jgi:phage anti-repressor protein
MQNKYKPLMDILGMQQEEEEKLYTPIDQEIDQEQQLFTPAGDEGFNYPVNDIVEADNVPNEPSPQTEDVPKIDYREQMLQQLRDMKSKRQEDVDSARDRDAQINLLNQLNKSFVGMNKALSSGYANVDPQALDLGKSNTALNVEKDYDRNLQNMMQEYKFLSSKDKEELSPYQKRALDLQERRLNLLTGKEGRLTKKDEFQVGVKNRLSDKEVEKVTQLDDGNRILDEIDSLLKTTDVEKDLGPYASRLENMSTYIPGVEKDTDFVKIQQLAGIQLADYVKSISGAAVSEEEAQRLLKNIPNMTDKPKEFKTKLETFRKDLKEAKQDYLQNIGKQKTGADKFLKDIESDTVLLQAPNGQTKRVKKETAQKYLDKGAIIIEE